MKKRPSKSTPLNPNAHDWFRTGQPGYQWECKRCGLRHRSNRKPSKYETVQISHDPVKGTVFGFCPDRAAFVVMES